MVLRYAFCPLGDSHIAIFSLAGLAFSKLELKTNGRNNKRDGASLLFYHWAQHSKAGSSKLCVELYKFAVGQFQI